MRTFDVVVIGAGVVGCSVAYQLAMRRARVCVIERTGIASGTTSASAGHISVQGRVPGPALELTLANLALLQTLAAELPRDIEFVQCGGTIVAEDEDEYRLLRAFVRIQAKHVDIRFLEAEELRRVEPGLSPRFLGATYSPLDGSVSPMGLARALACGARALGTEFLLGAPVTDLVHRAGKVEGVRTPRETVSAPVVVNAAGVWSPEVTCLVGLEVPVIPRKGQLLVSEPAPPVLHTIVSHAGHVPFTEFGLDPPATLEGELHKKRYMRQSRSPGFRGRVYIGSTSEFVGFDRRNTPDGLHQLAEYAVATIPALKGVTLLRSWAGLRPRSRDGRFIIGEAPGLRGFYLATGHDSIGILHSGMTGKLLAELIVEGKPSLSLDQFAPGRATLAAGKA